MGTVNLVNFMIELSISVKKKLLVGREWFGLYGFRVYTISINRLISCYGTND